MPFKPEIRPEIVQFAKKMSVEIDLHEDRYAVQYLDERYKFHHLGEGAQSHLAAIATAVENNMWQEVAKHAVHLGNFGMMMERKAQAVIAAGGVKSGG